jgi:hypothetical protein
MAIVTIYHSIISGRAPPTLVLGQIAINTADGILYWLDADGVTIRSYNFINPSAPTKLPADSSVSVATTAFVQAAVAAIRGSPPPLLATLQALAAAVNNDPNYSASVAQRFTVGIRFDVAQTLSGAQLAQVQANIGVTIPDIIAGIATAVVRYDAAQALTAAQQAQAAANIGLSAGGEEGTI